MFWIQVAKIGRSELIEDSTDLVVWKGFWKLKCLKYFPSNNRVHFQFPDGHDLDENNKNLKLGGGNSNIFDFQPETWGRWFPIWLTHIFQDGLVQPPKPAVRHALTRMPRATRSRLDWSRLRPGTGRDPCGPSPNCLPGRSPWICVFWNFGSSNKIWRNCVRDFGIFTQIAWIFHVGESNFHSWRHVLTYKTVADVCCILMWVTYTQKLPICHLSHMCSEGVSAAMWSDDSTLQPDVVQCCAQSLTVSICGNQPRNKQFCYRMF